MGERDPDIATGGHAIVYGGGETGCETAEYLAHRGVRVTLVTRSRHDQLARSAEWVYRRTLVERLYQSAAIEIVDNSSIVRIADELVTLFTNEDVCRTIAEQQRVV